MEAPDHTEMQTPVAVIDIGSNELRMVIAQVRADGNTEVLERARRAVRLGHDTFLEHRLSQKTMNAAISVLREYRRMLATYGVETVRAVATSAVREADNMDAFLDRIARTVGLDVEVIQTTEQVRLIALAMLDDLGDSLPLQGTSLIAEVGGGSTLLAVLRGGEIAASQSFNVGSVRMQETLATAREPASRAALLLRRNAQRTIDLASRALDLDEARTFIAIGGDARFAADQVGQPSEADGLLRVALQDLDHLVTQCASCSPEELARRYGLPYADAETLVPALLVYQQLLEAVDTDTMLVSHVSMRDGLVLDLPRYLTGEEDPQIVAGMLRSARSIGQKYAYDQPHAEHVSELAVQLFDALRDEHFLTPRHRLLLRVAGLVHDVGVFVSSLAHHKHSYYLLIHSEIFGLSRDDIVTVAQVARYHRRSMPKSTHLEYNALNRDQRLIINKLAAILRVADALDRGHWQQLRQVEFQHEREDLVIYTTAGTDLALERRALAEKADLFEEVFGMHVRLEPATTLPGGADP